MNQSEVIDMNPAVYLHKGELECSARIVAMLFLVVGTAIISAALIVQISAANFQFGSVFIAICLLPLMILLLWLLLGPHTGAWRRSRCLFLSAGEPVVWRNRFANAAGAPPRVLIVDKDVFMRSALDFHLTRAGFHVEHAANKDEALSKMRERPAVVLFDLSLSSGNRFYGLRDLRKASPEAKVIVLTRKGNSRDESTCRKLGAYDSLLKPFDPNDAVKTVNRALSASPVFAL